VRIAAGRAVVVAFLATALYLGPSASAIAAPGDLTFGSCLGSLIGCPGVNPTGITSGAAGIALSPDGRNLYLGAHFGSAVSHFTFDAAGDPVFESCIGATSGCTPPPTSGVLDGARGLAVSPDGKQLYAAAWGGNAIAHFTLDAAGKPTFAGCIGNHAGCTAPSVTDALAGVERVTISPDGKHLYAAAPYRPNPAPNGGQAVSYFTLDAGGAPTFNGCVGARAGCTPIGAYPAAVAGARDLTVSANGKNLYVASTIGPGFSDSNTVAHFTLDAAGTPTFERCIGDQTGCTAPGVLNAVFGSSSIAVNRDGTRLYVGANNGIAFFTVDGAGVPTFAGCIANVTGCTQPTPPGLLFGAFGIELAPDGKNLYAAGYGSDAIAHFVLDANGMPALASCNGAPAGCAPSTPAGAVDGPFDFAVTPDGKRLYAAMYDGALIDRFAIEQPPASPPPAPAPTPDRTAPTLSGYALSRTTFAAASKGATLAVVAAKRPKPKIGTTIRFTLSEAATVTFTVKKATGGRKVKGKCVKPSRKNRKAKRCTRYVALKPSVRRASAAGRNSVKFTGRLHGRKLAPGRYRLVATARDAAGNAAKPKRVAFKIVTAA
jgi:DNA-binding beta-propeller fold protein YncE